MAKDPASSVLPFGNYIDTHPPPESFEVVLGVVALPTSPNYPALQTIRTGESNHPRRLFAKTGLIIKARTSFEIIVPPPIAAPAAHLGIGWDGTPSAPSQRIVVSNCPQPGRSDWLAYPGGYWLDHPTCAPLIVKTDGKEQQVHIGLGTPCPGQQPPQGPSEQRALPGRPHHRSQTAADRVGPLRGMTRPMVKNNVLDHARGANIETWHEPPACCSRRCCLARRHAQVRRHTDQRRAPRRPRPQR
jgi:hypothetical protein